jgi:hypothetical protein
MNIRPQREDSADRKVRHLMLHCAVVPNDPCVRWRRVTESRFALWIVHELIANELYRLLDRAN